MMSVMMAAVTAVAVASGDGPDAVKGDPQVMAAAAMAKSSLRVTTLSAESRAVGTPTVFTVAGDGAATVWADNCGHKTVFAKQLIVLKPGEAQTFSVALDEPGFLRFHAECGKVHETETVPYSPEKIVAGVTEPKDFDTYWKGELARLDATVPADVRVEKFVGHYGPEGAFDEYRLSFATFNGRRVYGFMAIPRGAKGPLPVRISVPGAGPGAAWAWDALPGEIAVSLNVVDYEPVEDSAQLKKLYADLNARAKKTCGHDSYAKVGWGVSREEVYFHDMIIGVVRGVRWISEQPFADRAEISYFGGSQGGGCGMAVVALSGDIFRRAVFYITAMSDFYGPDAGWKEGWPSPISLFVKGTVECETARRVAPYYDAVNFARRIHCDVLSSLGLEDETCPPPNVMASFNALATSRKRMVFEQDMRHGITPEMFSRVKKWLPRGVDPVAE